MLVGEPGIGKTRTAQELETYARMRKVTAIVLRLSPRGREVLVFECGSSDSAPGGTMFAHQQGVVALAALYYSLARYEYYPDVARRQSRAWA